MSTEPAYSSGRGSDALDLVTAVADDLDAMREQAAVKPRPPLAPGEARILTVTDREYHADPCSEPSLSASIAHTILSQSPVHAWLRHPKLGNQPSKPTDAKDAGTLYHAILLGSDASVEKIDANDYRTNAAKEARDAARDAGLVPILAREYDAAMAACEAIRANLAKAGIVVANGQNELPVEWRTSEGVLCRGRLDHLSKGHAQIVDLKSCRSAKPDDCAKSVISYGYDVQAAAYVQAVETLHPELAGRVEFVFAFFETEPPYAIGPYKLDAEWRHIGGRKWARACKTWARCLATGEWPGYATGVTTLFAPPWAMAQELEET